MAFDPGAATARYIDSLGPAALQKAHDYTVGKEWMLLWSLLVAAIVTLLIVRSGILDRLDMKLGEKRRNLRAFVIAFVYFIVSTILTLPWSIYADWWREKDYGRTSQPFSDWLLQLGIATVVSSLLGALFFLGVYWLMRRTAKRWWIWSGCTRRSCLCFRHPALAGADRALVQSLYAGAAGTGARCGRRDGRTRWRPAGACLHVQRVAAVE